MYRFYISYTKCTNSTKSDFQKCININHSYIKKYFSKKIVYIILKKIQCNSLHQRNMARSPSYLPQSSLRYIWQRFARRFKRFDLGSGHWYDYNYDSNQRITLKTQPHAENACSNAAVWNKLQFVALIDYFCLEIYVVIINKMSVTSILILTKIECRSRANWKEKHE